MKIFHHVTRTFFIQQLNRLKYKNFEYDIIFNKPTLPLYEDTCLNRSIVYCIYYYNYTILLEVLQVYMTANTITTD